MRFDGWEIRLNAVIDKYQRLPFEWGKLDCVLFAAAAAWCLTQKDAAAPWRGTYRDRAGARKLIDSFGGLEALVDKTCATAGIKLERIDKAFAQRGDVCLVETETGPALAVCVGSEVVGKSETGMERRPLSSALVVWAIR